MICSHSRLSARVLRAAAVLTAAGAFCFGPPATAGEPVGGGALTTNGQTRNIYWHAAGATGGSRYRVETNALNPDILRTAQAERWTEVQWQKVLSVYALPSPGADVASLPPMLGSYRLEGSVLHFEPRFPLTPGVGYRAVLTQPSGGAPGVSSILASDFQVPARAARPPTAVTQVYPTADVLPENLLKFYVHFSAPMNRGDIYDRVHLLDENGKEIESPFLELAEELWSPDMTRVTFVLSPGRIKRGLALREEMGPALTAGKPHALVIDREWKDGNGQPLRETFRKSFRIAEPDRTQPDIRKWKVAAPAAGGRAPVTIDFEKPMDHALADRLIDVVDASGRIVDGVVTLGDQERRWTLVPAAPWRAGDYRVVANVVLEDLAGNSLAKLFDVDVFDSVERIVRDQTASVPFSVR